MDVDVTVAELIGMISERVNPIAEGLSDRDAVTATAAIP